MSLFDDLSRKAKSLAVQVSQLSDNSSQKVTEICQSVSQSTSELCNSIADSARDIWDNKVPSKEEIAEWVEGSYNYITSLSKDFDADKMWEKVSTAASKAGQELIVMVLTIYYTISESIQKKDEQK
ncbi:MAG: hypothetical protein K2J42_00140 [Muribaculaceae bacterium]|nr:hypothetical protein [Muribaculaceae bacterium]